MRSWLGQATGKAHGLGEGVDAFEFAADGVDAGAESIGGDAERDAFEDAKFDDAGAEGCPKVGMGGGKDELGPLGARDEASDAPSDGEGRASAQRGHGAGEKTFAVDGFDERAVAVWEVGREREDAFGVGGSHPRALDAGPPALAAARAAADRGRGWERGVAARLAVDEVGRA